MTSSPHPFRFAVSVPQHVGSSVSDWQAQLARLEEIGFDTVVMADHFTQDYAMEPMVALTAAAMSTSEVRLQTGVLCNDYRHPVLVHRMAALLDVLSEGRFVLGIGAGWMRSDYHAAGLSYDEPSVRVGRLEESISVLKGLFLGEPWSFDGDHYTISELAGRPRPVQRPHPPFYIGGGSPRILRLAGREANVVGINARLREGEQGRHAIVDLAADRVRQKIEWIREGLQEAGRRQEEVELSLNNWLVRVTSTTAEANDFIERIASRVQVEPILLKESPCVLVGTVGECIEKILANREDFGVSHVQLDAGFAPQDAAALAPVVRELAGR